MRETSDRARPNEVRHYIFPSRSLNAPHPSGGESARRSRVAPESERRIENTHEWQCILWHRKLQHFLQFLSKVINYHSKD